MLGAHGLRANSNDGGVEIESSLRVSSVARHTSRPSGPPAERPWSPGRARVHQTALSA